METEKRTTGYVKLYTKEQMQRIKEKKTKEDMQKIALYRKQNPEQLILNLEVK